MNQTFTPPSYHDAPDATWTTADLCDRALSTPALNLRVLPPVYRSFGGRPWYFGPILAVPGACPSEGCSLAAILTEPGLGRVLVVDATAVGACAILGDRMAALAVHNGWSGVLMHGYVRDTQVLARMPVGVHALAAVPNRPASMPPARAGGELMLHGHAIRTGDWLYADADGIVITSIRHTEAGA
ncbi:ribonuclease [Pollutimonas sp. M17]|uniref:RraA family protein n=1 Tax=Pollutimonas sp. M17 TaxID=2962065 RepID=UPI0021F4AE9A|nr:ribonuclease [Pollutimonas sp. M17]UYO92902.1 ribonuclease [Pollutimonas sp. M17]